MATKSTKPRTTQRAKKKPAPKTPVKRATPRRPAKATSTKRAVAKPVPAKKAPAKKAATKKAATKKRPAKKAAVKRPTAGTLERAVFDELYALELHDTALGKSAIFLAKAADQSESASAVASALREMRMTISAAQVRGNPIPQVLRGGEQPAGDKADSDGVVPESRLDRLRREREEQRRDNNG